MGNLSDIGTYQAADVIWKVFPPIIIVIGTVGNVLTIVVLLQKEFRRSAMAIVLITLAFSDLLVLYTGCVRQWLIHVADVDVRTISDISCQVHSYLVQVGRMFSSWLLVLITIERFCCVMFPLQFRAVFTVKTIGIMTGVLATVLLCVDLCIPIGRAVIDRGKGRECYWKNDKFTQFGTRIYPWIDLLFVSLVPFIALAVGNTAIVVKLLLRHNKKPSRLNSSSSQTSTHSAKSGFKPNVVTTMLFALSGTFVLLTMPMCIYLIGYSSWKEDAGTDPKKNANLKLGFVIVNALMYTNNAINFVLYVFAGPRFRKAVMEFLTSIFIRSKRRRWESTSSNTGAKSLSGSISTVYYHSEEYNK